jgi:hypothetical protein
VASLLGGLLLIQGCAQGAAWECRAAEGGDVLTSGVMTCADRKESGDQLLLNSSRDCDEECICIFTDIDCPAGTTND